MNEETEPRFAYEKAEAILDAFASTQDDVFRRAWQKAKFMATAYAYADYYDEFPDQEPVSVAVAMARGWEELQIAFTGRGEASMTGAVWQLWDVLPGRKAEKKFIQAVKAAWAAAEKATPKDAVRLYGLVYRNAPLFRFVDDVWTPNVLMPNDGVRYRLWWEKDPDMDVEDQDDVAEHLAWLDPDEKHVLGDALAHWGNPAEA